jgi:hypothetical protein
MSVAVSDVRSQIRDLPRNIGVSPESPRAIGQGDGVTTVFYLPVGKLQYYFTVVPATFFLGGIAASPTTYSIAASGAVTFSVAPTSGVFITSQFQLTVFTDIELTNVLTRNQNVPWPDDRTTLKGCTYDIIDMLLLDTERLAMLREDTWEKDPAAVINAMIQLKKSLYTDLMGGPQPGQNIPFLQTASAWRPQYVPRR